MCYTYVALAANVVVQTPSCGDHVRCFVVHHRSDAVVWDFEGILNTLRMFGQLHGSVVSVEHVRLEDRADERPIR